ncbi:MAG: ABC transporter ATP-binding protein [Alphaproteobacteria bacterium]|nr:ABC transporter ATP-binding protein [Alphaproteobacteria bacterium]
MTAPLLAVEGLSVRFRSGGRMLPAVDGLDIAIAAGETVAVVGESGCGKSVTALAIMGLLPAPPDCAVAGRAALDGVDLLSLPPEGLRRLRGRAMAMVVQEPRTSLNPVFTVGDQIAEAVRVHTACSARAARARAVELLELVRIPDAARRLDDYPHRFSGGMRQRVMIAIAMACDPRLLIADEPTTALDVTIQAQILDLLGDLQARFGMALLLITHDLGVVARMARRVVVMYAGRKVEEAPLRPLFAAPRHPYTQGLMRASPHHAPAGGGRRLAEIPGVVPPLDALPLGCAFAPRCPVAFDRCRDERPAVLPAGDGRLAACFRAAGEAAPA